MTAALVLASHHQRITGNGGALLLVVLGLLWFAFGRGGSKKGGK